MIKFFLLIFIFFPIDSFAQIIPGWQHLDPDKDSVLGVSTYRAYEYLKSRKSKPVIVAVIDNGAELTHQDLQGQFWINVNEIEGNGIDDDKNGYIDDIHGWNFLGNSKGQNIGRETKELTRIYADLNNKFEHIDKDKLTGNELKDFEKYQKVRQAYLESVKQKKNEISLYQNILLNCMEADRILKEYFKKDNYTESELIAISKNDVHVLAVGNYMLNILKSDLSISKLEGIVEKNKLDLETRLNPEFNVRREIIGDNPDDLNDCKYGNNQVNTQGPYHGTGIAGTIGALYNGIGIDGIAKNVKLMILRVLPNGDERDKDVALAILYAVNNHAEIINCSFGKPWSAHPEFVEYAMRKAEKAGVLIVHASGNEGQNNDSIATYPTGYYADGTRAKNWINVGASQSKDNENLVAPFSNYGIKSVDIFAPGVDINSCILGSKYELASGTSVSAPVVSGIAAVLKSYYPKLTATQIKEIIIHSAYIPNTKEIYLGEQTKKKTKMNFISVSGGIANLYKAILYIEAKKY